LAAHHNALDDVARERMERITRKRGRVPRQRHTIHRDVTTERYRASFAALLHSRAASLATVVS
jgi:hypothetical protein